MSTTHHSPQATKTLAALRDAISRRGDFPSMSASVRQIVAVMRDEASADFDMAQCVLSDFALTQKVIRLANSAMYSAFGGNVTTISRAIYVLGTETIGHLALGLKFIDQLEKAVGQTDAARAEFSKAMVAGAVSRKVTESMSARETEESVVCTLLHSLGRLLVTFYLPAEWTRLESLLRVRPDLDEQSAAGQILGLSLHALGQELAQGWGLPDELTGAMREPVPVGDNPLSHADWLASLANFSTECSKVMATSEGADMSAAMQQLATVYAPSLGLDVASLSAAAAAATEDEDTRRLIATGRGQKPHDESEKPLDAYGRLDAGLRDMEALAPNADMGTLAGLMLESMHTSMGFRRVFLFLRNGQFKTVAARMALGEGARDLMPALSFGEAFEPDVFHFSMAQNKPVFIEDARHSSMAAKLPRWYKERLGASRSFVCVPLVAGALPVGFVYGDWETETVKLRLEPHEFGKIVKMRDVLLGVLTRNRKN